MVVDEPCLLKPDCSGVVQCHKRGRLFSVSGNRPMAGLYRKMLHSNNEMLFFNSDERKTKAHKVISAIAGEGELEKATGNDQADYGAKNRATALAATEPDLMFFKEARLNWLGAARVVAATLAVFGPKKKTIWNAQK